MTRLIVLLSVAVLLFACDGTSSSKVLSTEDTNTSSPAPNSWATSNPTPNSPWQGNGATQEPNPIDEPNPSNEWDSSEWDRLEWQ